MLNRPSSIRALYATRVWKQGPQPVWTAHIHCMGRLRGYCEQATTGGDPIVSSSGFCVQSREFRGFRGT